MTINEFNLKYFDHLEKGHYGLDISIPSIIEYLDEEFPKIIKRNPNFQYSQIKIKFKFIRFYYDCDENLEYVTDKLQTLFNESI